MVQTRVEKVMQVIKDQLEARLLVAGAKLPSVRLMAQQQSVSISTVITAYDRLSAEGLIASRPGSGFFVDSNQAALPHAITTPVNNRDINPLWVARQALEAPAHMTKPGCGWLPPDWLPEAALRRAIRSVAKNPVAALTEYAHPLGDPQLRHILAQRLMRRNLRVNDTQIMITDSGSQAMDLICRLFLQPGDKVLLDDPGYFNFRALLQAQRADIRSISLNQSGPDLEQFEQQLRTEKPKLYITNSCLHNPTGISISPVVAHKILSLCESYGVTIIEDDIFGDLDPVGSPLLASFDGLDNVIHISSFSKTVSASIRCGYIACRANWIEDLQSLKIATHYTTSRLGAEIMRHMLLDGSYAKSVDALKIRLAKAMSYSLRSLGALGIEPAFLPAGGMFLWCKLPEDVAATKLAQDALQSDVLLAPGPVFSVAKDADHYMRFNIAQCHTPAIFETFETLLRKTRTNP